MSYADLPPETEEETTETPPTPELPPAIAELHARMEALEQSVSKLRGLVFAFKPKKGA